MARQFPKAPMRIFDNRKEADAWLLEISNAPNIEKPGKKKKYYAVAQGAITGIFESVEMYEKATNGFHNALARSFRDRKAAEIWLASVSGKTFFQNTETPEKPSAGASILRASPRGDVKADGITANASVISQKQITGKKNVPPAQKTDATEGPALPAAPDKAPDAKLPPADAASVGEAPAKNSLFRGVQFDKHIFRGISAEAQQRFRKTFAQRLAKLERIFRGSHAAGNDFKLVAPTGRRVFKRRIGKNRLSMVLKDGILTLLRISTHDRQMADIRNLRGKSIGYVYTTPRTSCARWTRGPRQSRTRG